jgi:hypothetical protein
MNEAPPTVGWDGKLGGGEVLGEPTAIVGWAYV